MKKNNQKLVVWAIAILAGIALVKSQISTIQRWFASLFAKPNGQALYNELNPKTPPTISNTQTRTSFVKSIADDLKRQFDSWNTYEDKVVKTINELANAAEAAECAAYYQATHNRSLKSDLQEELYPDWNILYGRYSDIKDYIKNNII